MLDRSLCLLEQLLTVLQAGDLGFDPGDTASQIGELGFVVETEHPPTAVADAVSIVLLVSVAAVSDLTGESHTAWHTAQFVVGCYACVVEPLGEMVPEPFHERPRTQLELSDQRILAGGRRGGSAGQGT